MDKEINDLKLEIKVLSERILILEKKENRRMIFNIIKTLLTIIVLILIIFYIYQIYNDLINIFNNIGDNLDLDIFKFN